MSLELGLKKSRLILLEDVLVLLPGRCGIKLDVRRI